MERDSRWRQETCARVRDVCRVKLSSSTGCESRWLQFVRLSQWPIYDSSIDKFKKLYYIIVYVLMYVLLMNTMEY